MVWQQIAMAGVNILEGGSSASSKRKLAKSQYKYEKGRAQNAALANASQNMLNMADANVARYQQWRDNNKKLDAMGEALRQDTWNFGKQIDQMNSAKFEQRIQAAGQLGSILAESAAAGVGGASVEAVYEAEKFKADRQQWAMSEQIKDAEYGHTLNQVAIMDNGYNSLDSSAVFSSLNYQAQDMVFDTSWEHNYSPLQAASDGFNGFTGNMNNLGLDVSSFMGGSSGKNNKGLGGNKGPTVKGQGAGQKSGAIRL